MNDLDHLDNQSVKKTEELRYLGLAFQRNGDNNSYATQRISTGWSKWRQISGVPGDKLGPSKLNGKFYRTVVSAALPYGSEFWTVMKSLEQRMQIAEMLMLR